MAAFAGDNYTSSYYQVRNVYLFNLSEDEDKPISSSVFLKSLTHI